MFATLPINSHVYKQQIYAARTNAATDAIFRQERHKYLTKQKQTIKTTNTVPISRLRFSFTILDLYHKQKRKESKESNSGEQEWMFNYFGRGLV